MKSLLPTLLWPSSSKGFDTVSKEKPEEIDRNRTIFYDIETSGMHGPYAELKMIGYRIGDNEPGLVEMGEGGAGDRKEFRAIMASASWTKVSYNGINFDDIVLGRCGYWVHPEGRHDVYLMAKTCCSMLPAYGLKFVNWYFYGDPHEPERRLWAWCRHRGESMWNAPEELLGEYCMYDVVQTARLFDMFWPVVTEDKHWRAYAGLELPMGEVLHEIMMEGGECLNLEVIKSEIRKLQRVIEGHNKEASIVTGGEITNLGSAQVAERLKYVEHFEIDWTDKGHLQLRKDDLLTLLDLDNPSNDKSRLARLTYEYRGAIKQLGYLKSYRRALLYELRRQEGRRTYRQRGYAIIPKSYSLSGARTRRILSSSHFGINFQNQNKYSKGAQLVPPGWIGIWLDSTQIENVVHIWASDDDIRRAAYEADPDWNEYVWLSNRILGKDLKREDLDRINSPVNPSWSVYKQYKTIKLALNFGLGVTKYSRVNRLSERDAKRAFEDIHRACPAIRYLQRKVKNQLIEKGYVEDPWGHTYSGDPDKAYKVVAYFIQGCGTGSVPKAMARAIWEELQLLNRKVLNSRAQQVWEPFDTVSKLNHKVALMTTLTHDEIGYRIWSDQPYGDLIDTIQRTLDCMEGRFSKLFNGIPLRAKMSMSITNAAEAKVLNHYQMKRGDWLKAIIEYIDKAREKIKG